jgi:hypothetical protein
LRECPPNYGFRGKKGNILPSFPFYTDEIGAAFFMPLEFGFTLSRLQIFFQSPNNIVDKNFTQIIITWLLGLLPNELDKPNLNLIKKDAKPFPFDAC